MQFRTVTSDLIEALKDQSITLKSIQQQCGFQIHELILIAQCLQLPKRKRGRKAKVQQ